MTKQILTVLVVAALTACQQMGTGPANRSVTGRNLGAAQWEKTTPRDAKTRIPDQPANKVVAVWSRTLPVGQYQELWRVQVGLTYAKVQMAEASETGFARTLADNQFRLMFQGYESGGNPVPHRSLRPELVNGVQQATYMSGTRPCLVFYRAAGYVIGAAFGIDGTAYLAGGACGPMKADPAAFHAEMNAFAAGIRVGRE
ncbi:MAG: hypothetical protein H6907_00540 [Hyphomicrobiales bacterium]|nr:hypothetical protein [Hyphomicrobiales bacterium]MCP5370198.1 hypothetical protein [Hyphomicrobiales bacterium]